MSQSAVSIPASLTTSATKTPNESLRSTTYHHGLVNQTQNRAGVPGAADAHARSGLAALDFPNDKPARRRCLGIPLVA